MMKFSVRTRLTFWYVTILTISLVSMGMGFFYTLSRVYVDRVDEQISSVSGMLAHTIVRPPAEVRIPKNFDVILERFFGVRIVGNYIQIDSPAGDIMAKSSTLADFELPLSENAFLAAKNGDTTFETIRTFGVYPVRLITTPIMMKDYGFIGIIQVGSSLEGMDEVYRRMTYLFVFGLMASVAVAGCAGWFLAREALRPVTEITKAARRITVQNLNERISIKGPEDEIGRLAATLNGMIGRLERSFSQIKQFTEDASHELKTPLTIMKGEIEVTLRSASSPEELKTTLVSLLEEIDRMGYIVNNLLMLARADVDKERAARQVVKFDFVVSGRFEQIKRMAAEKGIRLELEENEPLQVLADPVALSQVVYNLVDNAIKYTRAGGSVIVRLEESGGFAVFSVTDTGVGIAGEDLPYVFDRFYRVDKARTREQGGAGLGLSICKDIVESFDGRIEATSVLGRGSTFIVRLPVAVFE
ncbi:MAG TPA: ATP-binding protein [Thermodesulfobacteriota bacterium]|nr:ATP-binding protein [Thermodesulfobacteriota bacterium]